MFSNISSAFTASSTPRFSNLSATSTGSTTTGDGTTAPGDQSDGQKILIEPFARSSFQPARTAPLSLY